MDRRAASGREVGKFVTDEAERVAQAELHKAIAPVVKEAITEDLVQKLHQMIGSLPDAIDAMAEDLTPQPDPEGGLSAEQLDRRQRAYTQLFKLTAGNRNLVPDINADKNRDLTVVFENMPRATDATTPDAPGTIETKQCDACGLHKPNDAEHFVSGTERCRKCFTEMRESAMGLLGTGAVEHDNG